MQAEFRRLHGLTLCGGIDVYKRQRIWCEAKALLLYQNDNERIYHAKKCINYAERGINRNPFLPPLEKGEVARLIIFFWLAV